MRTDKGPRGVSERVQIKGGRKVEGIQMLRVGVEDADARGGRVWEWMVPSASRCWGWRRPLACLAPHCRQHQISPGTGRRPLALRRQAQPQVSQGLEMAIHATASSGLGGGHWLGGDQPSPRLVRGWRRPFTQLPHYCPQPPPYTTLVCSSLPLSHSTEWTVESPASTERTRTGSLLSHGSVQPTLTRRLPSHGAGSVQPTLTRRLLTKCSLPSHGACSVQPTLTRRLLTNSLPSHRLKLAVENRVSARAPESELEQFVGSPSLSGWRE